MDSVHTWLVIGNETLTASEGGAGVEAAMTPAALDNLRGGREGIRVVVGGSEDTHCVDVDTTGV